MIVRSKPLSYAIALNELGADVVHNYIGQEPSGRKFNDLDLDYNSERIIKYFFVVLSSGLRRYQHLRNPLLALDGFDLSILSAN